MPPWESGWPGNRSTEEHNHSRHWGPDQATDKWSCFSVDPRVLGHSSIGIWVRCTITGVKYEERPLRVGLGLGYWISTMCSNPILQFPGQPDSQHCTSITTVISKNSNLSTFIFASEQATKGPPQWYYWFSAQVYLLLGLIMRNGIPAPDLHQTFLPRAQQRPDHPLRALLPPLVAVYNRK